MKKIILILTIISSFALIPFDKTLTKQERDFAVQYMTEGRDSLLMDVKGSYTCPAQLESRYLKMECGPVC